LTIQVETKYNFTNKKITFFQRSYKFDIVTR